VLNAERRVQQAQQAYNATAQPLADAQAAVGPAQNAATAANAALQNAQAATAAAQQRRDGAQSAVDAQQQQVSQLTAQRDQAQQAIGQVSAQIASLDARAARILAEPLNRPDLEQAADAELAALSDLRGERAGLYAQRAGAIADRVAALETQDQAADQLAQLISVLTSWNDGIARGHYNTVTAIITSLEGIVDASRAQRATPDPRARTDDLTAAQQTLASSLAGLQAVLARARGEQTSSASKLTGAARALADWQQDPA
jgi:chromosome segregation ATPase